MIKRLVISGGKYIKHNLLMTIYAISSNELCAAFQKFRFYETLFVI